MYIRARRVKILAWLRGHRLYSVLTWTCWNVEHVSLRSCSTMKEPGLWPDTAHRIKHALLTSVYACPPLSLHSQDPLFHLSWLLIFFLNFALPITSFWYRFVFFLFTSPLSVGLSTWYWATLISDENQMYLCEGINSGKSGPSHSQTLETPFHFHTVHVRWLDL